MKPGRAWSRGVTFTKHYLPLASCALHASRLRSLQAPQLWGLNAPYALPALLPHSLDWIDGGGWRLGLVLTVTFSLPRCNVCHL